MLAHHDQTSPRGVFFSFPDPTMEWLEKARRGAFPFSIINVIVPNSGPHIAYRLQDPVVSNTNTIDRKISSLFQF
jgi:hypothetical protein